MPKSCFLTRPAMKTDVLLNYLQYVLLAAGLALAYFGYRVLGLGIFALGILAIFSRVNMMLGK